MKPKNLIWILPVSIIIIALIAFGIFGKYHQVVCGDGLCEKSELNSCSLDCKSGCVQATGATDNQINEQCSIGWSATYMQGLDFGAIKPEWLSQDNTIDFTNEKIQKIAKTLKRDNVKDTARATAEWTYKNIRYDSSNTYGDCLGKKSSDIIERGYGVCSTMSKVNIALLRANGIAAYSVTGCFKFNEACKLQQTFFGNRFPKFLNITIEPSGYAPTMGYLHNWVIFPLYENGKWEDVILESTSGLVFAPECINYKSYYPAAGDYLACGLSGLDPNLRDCQKL